MGKVYDKPIIIQKIDEVSEEWTNLYCLHARINKSKLSDEYLNGGAIQEKRHLTFEVRYFRALEDIAYNTQCYRILYRDNLFNITDFDDYLLQHKIVKLQGVSY
ncbi:head-tail adaptor protein [Anaerovoracaceae bacterium 41-7]|uniref:phage head completion protein n=1 Tax=Emergencia sp. JLR.KK010 TaxID=3114296 RepID=UPI0030D57DBC